MYTEEFFYYEPFIFGSINNFCKNIYKVIKLFFLPLLIKTLSTFNFEMVTYDLIYKFLQNIILFIFFKPCIRYSGIVTTRYIQQVVKTRDY